VNPILPSGLDQGVFKTDWSTFSHGLDCARKWWFTACWRRRRVEKAPARDFGSAMHEALHARQELLMRESDAGAKEQMRVMERALEAVYKEIVLPAEDHRTLGRAIEIAALYVKEHDPEPFEIVESEQALERELGEVELHSRSFPSRRITVVWQGKIDGIWRRRDTGQMAVKDSKTMEQGDFDRELRKYRMSGQFRMYCWMKGLAEAVEDVIVVRPPLLRPTAKSKPREEFWRVVQDYSEEEIEETRADTLRQIKGLLELASEPLPPPGNSRHCHWCEFYGVCEQRGWRARVDWLMSGEFEANTWNPMGEKGTK
jgi:CRISPR/Cas system-associated exonuclease Cas4 (RecB family)